jgi:hypothetical protein
VGLVFAVALLFGCDGTDGPGELVDAPPPPAYDSALPTPPPPPPEAAILLSGPVSGRGIPFLPPNVISFSYALYEIDENRLEVYYTDDDVFGVEGWEGVDCGAFTLRRSVSEEIFLYESPAGWRLLVVSGVFLDDPCGVFGGLTDRVAFFSGSLGPGQSPLPAVFLIQQ